MIICRFIWLQLLIHTDFHELDSLSRSRFSLLQKKHKKTFTCCLVYFVFTIFSMSQLSIQCSCHMYMEYHNLDLDSYAANIQESGLVQQRYQLCCMSFGHYYLLGVRDCIPICFIALLKNYFKKLFVHFIFYEK